MASKVAVVTGSNKGIGYGIVKELCKRGVGTVYLTARDKIRGEKAVEDLKKESYNPTFFQLDISNKESVKALAQHLKEKHNGLDILINNAGVGPKDMHKTTYDDSKQVIETNYSSILSIREFIFPILKENARVVNIASDCGHITNLNNSYWVERLTKPDIKVEDINAFVNWFLDSVKNETLNAADFISTVLLSYRVSKIAVCALTRVLQNEVGHGISVNSLHPGFVKTDLTKGAGLFTLEEASKTPAYLVLDADQSLKGKFVWYDKTEKDWTDTQLNLFNKEVIDMYKKSVA